MNTYEKMYGWMRRATLDTAETIDNLEAVNPRKQPPPTERTVDTLVEHGLPRHLADELRDNIARPQQETAQQVVQQRPSWDEFFFSMAELASTMATCPRAHCGAAIVRHKRVLSLGFNGAPPGEPHCPSEGETLAEHLALAHCQVSVHAEANALKNAVGNVYGATIYVYGHRAVCGNCKGQLALVGITDIRHRPGPHHGVTR